MADSLPSWEDIARLAEIGARHGMQIEAPPRG
jgi:hypothetical protein